MTEMISVFLTSAQKNKFLKGQTFQLSAHQLQAGSGKHNVEIAMTPKNHKELLKNVSKNKGYRFTKDKIVTGGALPESPESEKEEMVNMTEEKTGGKLKKGSPEMIERMANLRAMRKGKGIMKEEVVDGEGIIDDLKKTFNPKLGRKIKDALTSKTAKKVYKGIAKVASSSLLPPVISGVANSAIDGLIGEGLVKKKRRYRKANTLVVGGTLAYGVPSLQLKGKGFTSENGTHYGGSFKSPTQGGSFLTL
jgi:hypothetical protein